MGEKEKMKEKENHGKKEKRQKEQYLRKVSQAQTCMKYGESLMMILKKSTLDRGYNKCKKPKMACGGSETCLRNSQELDNSKDFRCWSGVMGNY